MDLDRCGIMLALLFSAKRYKKKTHASLRKPLPKWLTMNNMNWLSPKRAEKPKLQTILFPLVLRVVFPSGLNIGGF